MFAPRTSAHSLLFLLVLLFSFSGGAVWGQVVPVEPGAYVRLSTGTDARGRPAGPKTEGSVIAVTPDSLVLFRREGTIRIPSQVITRIDVKQGRRPAGQRVLRGAGFGLLLGGGGGALAGYAMGDDSNCAWVCFSAEDKAMILGVLLGGSGIFVGGIAGGLSRGERWQRVPLPTRMSLSPRGQGIAFSASLTH